MKLKRMEITGFKSFVEKAAIDFPPGISAIVGPNGCGKSNVVDALRWAMGEQSVKQLRGKSMEDVIFAGTSGRAAVNMAEVSLILDNDNGTGPESLRDFTEIMVTRRLYRSGESTYLLNKRPCRLKDIHNIFLGSGMGSRSYAVIGQGNIGAITEAGPEERRVFIEEAAGITRYKNRKAEALRKLDATNQNLLRVTDIIAEVERQMRGLKRQARKAQRYQRYQDRAKHLDLRLSIRRYDEASAGLAAASEQLNALRDEEASVTAALRKSEAAAESIRLERSQKDQKIAREKGDRVETQRTIDRLENDLAHLRKAAGRLADEARELTSARTELEERHREVASEVTQMEAEEASLEADLAAVDEATAGADADLAAAQADLDARRPEQQEAAATVDRLAREEASHNQRLQTARATREGIHHRLRRADEAAALAERGLADAQTREAEARRKLADAKAAGEALRQAAAALEGRMAERTEALMERVRAVQAAEASLSGVRSKHSALKEMEARFEWYRDGVRAVMTRPDGADGILGLTADVIAPSPEVETAVEAVLGEALQYVLVRDEAVGAEAVGYLQETQGGRCGFIPMTSVAPADGDGTAADPSTRLLPHVTARPGFEGLAAALLGEVRVADDLPSALAVHRDNGSRRPVVTRDGQVITESGTLIGGSAENLAGILRKKGEIRDLEAQIDQLTAEKETAAAAREALEAELAEVETELKARQAEKKDNDGLELDAQRAVYREAEAAAQAARSLSAARDERDRLEGEVDGLDAEMDRSHSALTRLSEETAQARRAAEATAEKVETAEKRVEELREASVSRQLKRTQLAARLDNARSSVRRLRSFQEDGAKRLEQLDRDIRAKEKRSEETANEIAEGEHQLMVRYENLRHLAGALERSEAEYAAIDRRLRETLAASEKRRNRREEIRTAASSAELTASKHRMDQENIESRLSERYHRGVAELRASLGEDAVVSDREIESLTRELGECREQIEKLGEVNLGAIREYEALSERNDFLCGQRDDLVKAMDDLHKVIRKINRITQEKFLETFALVNEKLAEVFPRLFEGGTAKLVLTEPDRPLETGVELMVHPPGKKLTRLSLLSGGEKALSAIAFIFAIFLIRPASFCIMDEIDAPLDDANVLRFNDLLQLIGEQSQIVMITHKRRSMEFADTLFGITMEKKGVSKVVSVNLE